MNNWKDYVALNQFEKLNDAGQVPVAMLAHDENGSTQLSFRVFSEKVEPTLTESEVGDTVEKLLCSFKETADTVDQAKLRVGWLCKRGPAEAVWNNVVVYKGVTSMDAGIFVAECQGKYAVIPNPNFQAYGCKFTTDGVTGV